MRFSCWECLARSISDSLVANLDRWTKSQWSVQFLEEGYHLSYWGDSGIFLDGRCRPNFWFRCQWEAWLLAAYPDSLKRQWKKLTKSWWTEPRDTIEWNLALSIGKLLRSLFCSFAEEANLFLSSIFTFLNYLKKQ